MQENDGQQKHQYRPDDPVLDQGKPQYPEIGKDLGQFFIPDFGKRWIHHQDQADGNGNIGATTFHDCPEIFDAGEKISPHHPDKHGQEDPEGEEAVEEG